MPQELGAHISGDVPHTNANGQYLRLLRHFLLLERQDTLAVCSGLPPQWLQPSAKLVVDNVPTEFGDVSLFLQVTDDGKTLDLRLEPGENFSASSITITRFSFEQAGFIDADNPEQLLLNKQNDYQLTLKK